MKSINEYFSQSEKISSIDEYLLSKKNKNYDPIESMNGDMLYDEMIGVLEASDYAMVYDETGSDGIDKETFEILHDVDANKVYAKQDHTQVDTIAKIIRIMNKTTKEKADMMYTIAFNKNMKIRYITMEKYDARAKMITNNAIMYIPDLKKYMKE